MAFRTVLVWMSAAGSAYLGWRFTHLDRAEIAALLFDLSCARRHRRARSDQMITAQVMGMRPSKVRFMRAIRARAAGPASMQAGGHRRRRYLSVCHCGLPDNVSILRPAGALSSPHYNCG